MATSVNTTTAIDWDQFDWNQVEWIVAERDEDDLEMERLIAEGCEFEDLPN